MVMSAVRMYIDSETSTYHAFPAPVRLVTLPHHIEPPSIGKSMCRRLLKVLGYDRTLYGSAAFLNTQEKVTDCEVRCTSPA